MDSCTDVQTIETLSPLQPHTLCHSSIKTHLVICLLSTYLIYRLYSVLRFAKLYISKPTTLVVFLDRYSCAHYLSEFDKVVVEVLMCPVTTESLNKDISLSL